MNFGLDLNLHVGLEQKLSPQMIQSLKLLQMNSLELEMVVKQELETNPLLEPVEEGEEIQDENSSEDAERKNETDEPPVETAANESDSANEPSTQDVESAPADQSDLDRVIPDDPKENKEIDWESYLEEGFDLGSKRTEEMESPDERFEKVPVYSKTLQDFLLGQLQDRTLDAKVAELVEYLINSLDERGYLVPEAKFEEPEEDNKAGSESDRRKSAKTEAPTDVADEMVGHSSAVPKNHNLSYQASGGNGSFHAGPGPGPAGPAGDRNIIGGDYDQAVTAASDKALADSAVPPEAMPASSTINGTREKKHPERRVGREAPLSIPSPAIEEIQTIIEGTKPLDAASHDVREAFHVIQSMDPSGIGARNLRECLLLQIHRFGRVSPLARRIVEEEFELLEKLKVAAIGKKFDVPPEQIQAAIREIGTLEPHPGRLVSATVANSITPDLIVEDVDGVLVLMLNDRSIPSLKVSRAYAELLKKGSRASTDEKKYVREKLNSATWLIRAIEQRKSTMLKVMQAIMESQPDFFKLGPTHLRPLILQDVADKIGMHISTVSRVTNGKYVQTGHGIFELKYFFTAGVTQSDGREISSVTTKDEIKKLIESEDTKRPLSDQKIVEILKAKGLDVARRTVAKYRDQLEILPARLRKQY